VICGWCWHAGTQKEPVTKDYEQWIHVGMVKAAPRLLQGLEQLVFPGASTSSIAYMAVQPAAGMIFKRRLSQTPKPLQPAEGRTAASDSSSAAGADSPEPLLSMCLNLNSSLCSSSVAFSSSEGFILVVYNPIARAYAWGVRVPVAAGSYSVTTLAGKPVQSQLLPLSAGTNLIWPSSASAQEAANKPSADLALVVAAPALGHAVYKITRVQAEDSEQAGQNTTAASEVITIAANSSSKLSLSGSKLQVEVMATGITAVTFAGQQMNYSSSLIKYQGR
jgi:hypothetical protein